MISSSKGTQKLTDRQDKIWLEVNALINSYADKGESLHFLLCVLTSAMLTLLSDPEQIDDEDCNNVKESLIGALKDLDLLRKESNCRPPSCVLN